jgi:hypothetical protein
MNVCHEGRKISANVQNIFEESEESEESEELRVKSEEFATAIPSDYWDSGKVKS